MGKEENCVNNLPAFIFYNIYLHKLLQFARRDSYKHILKVLTSTLDSPYKHFNHVPPPQYLTQARLQSYLSFPHRHIWKKKHPNNCWKKYLMKKFLGKHIYYLLSYSYSHQLVLSSAVISYPLLLYLSKQVKWKCVLRDGGHDMCQEKKQSSQIFFT